jgi:hypothetical protein
VNTEIAKARKREVRPAQHLFPIRLAQFEILRDWDASTPTPRLLSGSVPAPDQRSEIVRLDAEVTLLPGSNCTTLYTMKTVVYRWRLSSERKAELEAEARREGMSLSAMLDRISGDWLALRRARGPYDEADQAAIRKRVMKTLGSIAGGDSTRSQRTSELVREIIYEKHIKESNALARRFVRQSE